MLIVHSPIPTESFELNDANPDIQGQDTEDGDHCNRHDDLLVW